MFSKIQNKAARAAKRAGLLTGGLLMCAVGTGFLTVSAWFALVPMVGLTMTALIIGGAYLGVGCIMIGVTSGEPAEHDTPAEQRQTAMNEDAPALMQAFMYGMQAGGQAGRR